MATSLVHCAKCYGLDWCHEFLNDKWYHTCSKCAAKYEFTEHELKLIKAGIVTIETVDDLYTYDCTRLPTADKHWHKKYAGFTIKYSVPKDHFYFVAQVKGEWRTYTASTIARIQLLAEEARRQGLKGD